MNKGRLTLGFLGILMIAAAPATADWLVTRAGGRVETKGPWQVKGKLVVFTQAADGALASLRLADVDLDASRKATDEAKAKAAAPPAPQAPKKKLAVLTDEKFHKAAATVEAKPAAAAATASPAAAATGPVAVGSWKRVDTPGGDGIEIQGTLHNETDNLLANAAVEVQLYNEAGDRIATAAGILSAPTLQPRGTVDFRAPFPGVFAFTQVKFEAKGLPLDSGPANPHP